MYNGRLVSVFYALCCIAVSCSVVCILWDNQTLVNMKGWISANYRMFQPSEESLGSINLKRQVTVRDFCRRNDRANESLDVSKLKNVIVDEKYKILYCYIPKIACTQWKTVMASLHQTKPKYWIHDQRNFRFLHQYSIDEANVMLKTYFKMVFVREPFERLLSAYLDKFYRLDFSFWYDFGRKIIERYRPGGKPEDKNVTFDEFLNYVQHIGNGYWNEHWQTYDKLCHPCAIHYDFIGRFENLEQEARYALEMSGITRSLNVTFPQVKPSTTSYKMPFFYSQIPKKRLHSIVKLFARDSEMFGYDFPKAIYDFIR